MTEERIRVMTIPEAAKELHSIGIKIGEARLGHGVRKVHFLMCLPAGKCSLTLMMCLAYSGQPDTKPHNHIKAYPKQSPLQFTVLGDCSPDPNTSERRETPL